MTTISLNRAKHKFTAAILDNDNETLHKELPKVLDMANMQGIRKETLEQFISLSLEL